MFVPKTSTAGDHTLLSISAKRGARGGADAEVPAASLGEDARPVARRRCAGRLSEPLSRDWPPRWQ